MFDDAFPGGGVRAADVMAKIAKNLRRLALADQNAYFARLLDELLIRQARHGRQVGDPMRDGWFGHNHAIGIFAAADAQRPTVERFLVRVIELESADPFLSFRKSMDHDLDEHVVGPLFAVGARGLAGMQVFPEEICAWEGQSHQFLAVDRHAGPFLRNLAACAVFGDPCAQTRVP